MGGKIITITPYAICKQYVSHDAHMISHDLSGVLIVSVRWRNRTFSGSLIDIGQHKWAPPRYVYCVCVSKIH